MAQIHDLESKSRFGTRYIVGIILAISTLLIAGWIGFFVFLPIKSGMSTVYELEERFLPRAEGMVLDFVSLSEPSIIITSDNIILDELHDGLNRDPIKLSDVPPFVINTLLAAEDSNYYQHEGVDFIAILSAVLDNLRGVTRGGSTITSQVAKQSFVGDEISIRRKVAEAVVASCGDICDDGSSDARRAVYDPITFMAAEVTRLANILLSRRDSSRLP